MEQIVEYKNDSGNGFTRTLLCFIQLFVVSNRTDTWYFANNNSRHFSFNGDNGEHKISIWFAKHLGQTSAPSASKVLQQLRND